MSYYINDSLYFQLKKFIKASLWNLWMVTVNSKACLLLFHLPSQSIALLDFLSNIVTYKILGVTIWPSKM